MRQKRHFSTEFKKQVVEEILSGTTKPTQVCRKYNIAPPVVAQWQKLYVHNELDKQQITEASQEARIEQLERMVGRLTLENDVLKKALKQAVSAESKSENLSETTEMLSDASERGAKC